MLILKIFSPLVILFITQNAYSKWICQETASLKENKNVLSCGVGEGKTESEARENALQNAKREFQMICQEDVTCKGYKTKVNPLRNSCDQTENGYKCYRGLNYEITNQKESDANLQNIENELQKKQKEYEKAKQLYKKQKELENLKEKMANKDFKEGPSEWNNFFHIGIQFGLAGIYSENYSITDFTSTFFLRYIPKKRWGIQIKSHNFDVVDDALVAEYAISYDSNTPISYSANGSIQTASAIYYFKDISSKTTSTGYFGLGVGNANFDFDYTYQEYSSFSTKTNSGKGETGVSFFTIGYTSSNLFEKNGEMGVDMGLDYYTFNQTSPHQLESMYDIYIALLWAF